MGLIIKKCAFLIAVLLLVETNSSAQENIYSCNNPAYNFLKNIIGNWKVDTKDRTSPDNYEINAGESIITDLINGCGIKESYRGTYKSNKYARESMIIGMDSFGNQMSILDSEHNSFSILNGEIKDGKIVVYWYRNEDVKKLQSKYILTVVDNNKFEFSSYLSTDYGADWALTHERIYTRQD